MNYFLLFNDIRPQRKCGAEVIAASILAGGSLLSGISNYATQSANQSMLLGASAEENAKQRQFAAQQASIANQRNMQNWATQFEAQKQAANEMFDKANAYNTPQAVVQRLMEAGFNPAAYFSGAGQSGLSVPSLSAPSSSPGSAVPGSSGNMAFSINPIGLDFTKAFEGISSAYEKFASAADKSSSARRTTQLLGAELKLYMEKANNVELLNTFQSLENSFQSMNLSNRAEKALQDTLLTASQVLYTKSNAAYLDEQTLTQKFKTLNEELDHSLKGEQLFQAKINSNYLESMLLSQLDATRAAAEASRAGAAYSSAQTETEIEKRPFEVSKASSEATLLRNEAFIDNIVRPEKLASVYERLKADKSLSQSERVEAQNILSLAKDYQSARSHETWRKLDSALEIAKKKFPTIIGLFK